MANQSMKLSQMVDAIGARIDDVIDIQTATEWLNAGLNQMAVSVGAVFPQLDSTNPDDRFVFDAKWQEIPIVYACAMFKGMDTAVQEKNVYMQQFVMMLKDFQTKYQVPIIYKDDMYTEQFRATADQVTFTITDPDYNESTADLKVYVNGKPAEVITSEDTFTLLVSAKEGDYITAIWEVHTDLQEPPYSFWGW